MWIHLGHFFCFDTADNCACTWLLHVVSANVKNLMKQVFTCIWAQTARFCLIKLGTYFVCLEIDC